MFAGFRRNILQWAKKRLWTVAIAIVVFSVLVLGALELAQAPANSFSLENFLESVNTSRLPRFEIRFADLYRLPGQIQVLHPLSNDVRGLGPVQLSKRCDPQTKSLEKFLFPNSVSCDSQPLLSSGPRENGAKELQLIRYLNGIASLPEDFLATPPFLYQGSGASFAYLLLKLGGPAFDDRKWVKDNLALLRVSELPEVMTQYQLTDPEFTVIASLSQEELDEVIRGSSAVVTSDYLLVRNQSRLGFSPLSYWVYHLRYVRHVLQDHQYDLVEYQAGMTCLQRTSNICWTHSSQSLMTDLHRYTIALYVFLGLVVASWIVIYFRQLFAKRRERQRQRLALQVLSHEFRTPVSAMLLMIEQLRAKLESFDVGDQDRILQISNEIFHLQRIIEMSRSYLQADSKGVHFRNEEISSMNQWIQDFIGSMKYQVNCELLEQDVSIQADPFWLQFILTNLVQNAFAHGAAPVTIKLGVIKNKVLISVEDHGTCEFQSLSDMTEAFAKSSKSQGMGLGLNITRIIAEQAGGEIRFSTQPTSFTLALGRVT